MCRHDEVGTPICVTVDFQTIEQPGETVTIRDRDTMKQDRIAIADLSKYIRSFYLGIT